MGLLDQFSGLGNLNEDQTQGLLAAAAQMLQASGPSRTPASFGQVAGAGIGSYMAGSQASKQRRAEEEQARQLAAMRGLQMQGLQGELGDKELSRSKALELAELQKRFAQGGGAAMPSSAPAAPAPLGAQPMTSMPGQPQPMQPQTAQASGGGGGSVYEQQMSYAQFLQANGKVQEALTVAKAARDLRPKYSTTPQLVRGADGKLRNIQLAEDGSKPVELAYGVKPEMVEVGLGNRKQFVDKNEVENGQSFKMEVSPDAVYSANASRANAAATREVASATRYAADARRNQDTEMKLADDYRAQSKPFKEVGDAYRTIQVTLDKATTSPAATLAGATKFMKLLDPGSVVRESELGMALAASGVFDRAGNYYETLKRGKVLTPTQVKDFKAITEQIYTAAKQGQVEVDSSYRNQAKTYGLRPEVIIQDFGQNGKPPAAPQATAGAHSVKAPNGKTYTFPDAKSLANFKLSAGIK